MRQREVVNSVALYNMSEVWTRATIGQLIDLYRENECLWRTSTIEYKTIEDIRQNLLEFIPQIHGDTIRNKIQTFRNQLEE